MKYCNKYKTNNKIRYKTKMKCKLILHQNQYNWMDMFYKLKIKKVYQFSLYNPSNKNISLKYMSISIKLIFGALNNFLILYSMNANWRKDFIQLNSTFLWIKVISFQFWLMALRSFLKRQKTRFLRKNWIRILRWQLKDQAWDLILIKKMFLVI